MCLQRIGLLTVVAGVMTTPRPPIERIPAARGKVECVESSKWRAGRLQPRTLTMPARSLGADAARLAEFGLSSSEQTR